MDWILQVDVSLYVCIITWDGTHIPTTFMVARFASHDPQQGSMACGYFRLDPLHIENQLENDHYRIPLSFLRYKFFF